MVYQIIFVKHEYIKQNKILLKAIIKQTKQTVFFLFLIWFIYHPTDKNFCHKKFLTIFLVQNDDHYLVSH